MSGKWSKALAQGTVAGLIGFGTVALFFAVLNVAHGRSPFYTAAVLGAAVFHGVTTPAHASVTPETVIPYNALHLFVFIGFGIAAAALAQLADRGSHLWYVGLFFYMFVAFHLVAFVQALTTPMRAAIGEVDIWVAGIAASTVMALYLLWRHPAARRPQSWAG